MLVLVGHLMGASVWLQVHVVGIAKGLLLVLGLLEILLLVEFFGRASLLATGLLRGRVHRVIHLGLVRRLLLLLLLPHPELLLVGARTLFEFLLLVLLWRLEGRRRGHPVRGLERLSTHLNVGLLLRLLIGTLRWLLRSTLSLVRLLERVQ